MKTIKITAVLLFVAASVLCWQPAAALDDEDFPYFLGSTGDDLFDRYAEAVYGLQEEDWFTDSRHHPATLDDEVLAGWVDEFGDDPRYWQLRFWCALHRDAPPAYFTGQRESSWEWGFTSQPYMILAEAIDRDATNWVTLYLFSAYQDHNRRQEMDRLLEELPGHESWTAEQRQSLTDLTMQQELAELAWLDGMVSAAPDQAWPYYYRAAYWMNYGELDAALAELRLGNAAPFNVMPTCFPASYVIDGLEQGEFRGSQVLCGAILDAELSDSKVRGRTMETNRWRDFGKNVAVTQALGSNNELLNEFHWFSCRLGEARSAYPLEAVIAAELISQNVSFALVDWAASFSPRQRRALLAVKFNAHRISSSHSALVDAVYPFVADHIMMLPYLNLGNVVVAGGSSLGIDIARRPYEEEFEWDMVFANVIGAEVFKDLAWIVSNEYELNREKHGPIFEGLAVFDYDECDLPPGWYVR